MTAPLLFAMMSFLPPPSDQEAMVPLGPALRFDKVNGRVIIDAEVVLRDGPLEMLLCPRKSKEHESIFAADVKPHDVHAALLLVGALPGKPIQFDPPRPPAGQRIKIWIEREDSGKTVLIDAREWLRDEQAKRSMTSDFVFVGSQFVRAPGSERTFYVGDDGYLVCVANFPGAVIDVSQMSTANDAEQKSFVPFTERIPERGTKVRVILEPVVD